MKKLIYISALLCLSAVNAQVAIGKTTVSSNSAILDFAEGTNSGIILPNITEAASVNPTVGTFIFDTNDDHVKYWDGGQWIVLSAGAATTNNITPSSLDELGDGVIIGASTSSKEGVLVLESTSKALILPRVASPYLNVENPPAGYMAYDTDNQVIAVYNGTEWSFFGENITPSAITSIDCDGTTNNGTLTDGVAATSVSSVISYTGGDGSAHSGQIVTSTGVTGLTATLSAGSFATGDDTLTYNITGIPDSDGTAYFAIDIGGKTCTLARTVIQNITIPASITLAQDRVYMIASIYDQDYLPYEAPAGAATTNTQVADSSNEPVTVDVQGTITTTGVTVKIPVTATGSDTIPAYSTTITIPASLTEDGISRDLTLSWASQAYTASTTYITATIVAVNDDLNAIKLDINAGIGNDALGVLMGQFLYPYNNAGNTTTYSVRDVAGIPDRMFGVADNNSDDTTHSMLYIPVQAEDGSIWLNNNLGADYSNINSSSFNPAQQATSYDDYHAYGSLFQWGRKPDGHELITWTSSTTASLSNTAGTRTNNPSHADFITSTWTPADWRSSSDDTLWSLEISTNNPCPDGFRVPTNTDQGDLSTATNITNKQTAVDSELKLSAAGWRQNSDGVLANQSNRGYYWSSSADSYGKSYYYEFRTSAVNPNEVNGRAGGMSVRCIKD